MRLATQTDCDTVVELLINVSRWLASKGSDQWQHTPRVEKIRAGIDTQTVYLGFTDNHNTVGTITVDHFADPDFWNPEDEPHTAMYVHRMAVHRNYAGQSIGAQFLNAANSLAFQQRKKWLRLDAHQTNPELHAYYIKQGFQHLKTLPLTHRPSGALFQRTVTPNDLPAPQIVSFGSWR